jgi:hypothetical protein
MRWREVEIRKSDPGTGVKDGFRDAESASVGDTGNYSGVDLLRRLYRPEQW